MTPKQKSLQDLYSWERTPSGKVPVDPSAITIHLPTAMDGANHLATESFILYKVPSVGCEDITHTIRSSLHTRDTLFIQRSA
jgi:hypothetical protein